jgi:hypothetical protein
MSLTREYQHVRRGSSLDCDQPEKMFGGTAGVDQIIVRIVRAPNDVTCTSTIEKARELID